jgi:hypothetical protein
MGDLFSGPHLILLFATLICIPAIFYMIGFRNGKRKGQLIELQKQVKRQG